MVIALLAGVMLGTFYFGSLWWVVQRVADAPRPEMLLLVSFFARTAITVGGFFLVAQGRWERIAAGMIGFLVARTALVQLLKPQQEASRRP